MLKKAPYMKRALPIEEAALDGISFDKQGRMQYHPDFHPNQGKRLTLDELIYICKFHSVDDIRTLSYAVGKTEHSVASIVTRLRRDGSFEKYRSIPDEQWANILKGAEQN